VRYSRIHYLLTPLFSFTLVVLLACLPSQALYADSLGESLEEFFNGTRIENFTGPNYYEGQTRGYLSGGRFITKFPRKAAPDLTFTPPSASGGCGGIKLYGGAFSFVNLDQFKEYAQAVIQNAGGLVFELALQNLSPQIASAWRFIQDIIQKMQKYLNDSCYAARHLTAPLKSVFEDLNETLYGKRVDAERETAEDESDAKNQVQQNEDDTPENRRKQSVNVAWKALKTIAVPPPLSRHLIMSFTGTVILDYRNSFNQPNIAVKPATVTFENLLEGWSAGDVKVYWCDETDLCLNPEKIDAHPFDGLQELVRTQLQSIVDKLEASQSLTDDEITFISFVQAIPIYRLIKEYSRFPGGAGQIVDQVSDLLAGQLALAYIQRIRQVASAARADLDDGQGSLPGEYRKLLADLRDKVQDAQTKFDKTVTLSLNMLKTNLFVLELANKLTPGNLQQSIAFSQGMGMLYK